MQKTLDMEMDLPSDVQWIIERLEGLGEEAYAVGGCVRDTMLGRNPGDWDITTSAKPEQVKSAFPRTIDTGIAHGTVTVMHHHVGYEVTTYRIDGEYADNRHPDRVEFTTNLRMDLERRDFTINAMAYNPKQGLVDLFDGIGDLKRGVIRCVGDPGQRFDEDALRMLRAVRFSGQLGFYIEEQTRQAMTERAKHLEHISAERIRVELVKLLVSKDAGQIREAYETGMTTIFLPELDQMMQTEQDNPHHIYTVGEHSVRGIEWMNRFFGEKAGRWDDSWIPKRAEALAEKLIADCGEKQRKYLCLTMLLHDVAKPMCKTVDETGTGHFYGHPKQGSELARSIMKRLTFDNETRDMVGQLILYHDTQIEPKPRAVRKAASRIGKERMPLLFLVQMADVLAQNPDTIEPKLDRIVGVEKVFQQILQEESPLSLKELELSGRDLMDLGMKPGPEIGVMLQKMLDLVLENPSQNTRENLLDFVKKRMKR